VKLKYGQIQNLQTWQENQQNIWQIVYHKTICLTPISLLMKLTRDNSPSCKNRRSWSVTNTFHWKAVRWGHTPVFSTGVPRVAARGSAETDRNCLWRHLQTQLNVVVAIPLFHCILATMNGGENRKLHEDEASGHWNVISLKNFVRVWK